MWKKVRWGIGFSLLVLFLMIDLAFALTPEEIVTNSNPSIVRILIEVKPRDNRLLQFYNRANERFKDPIRVKAGTGFIINPEGYIMTAYHVVTPLGLSPTIYVRLPKEGDYLAKIVAEDKERQLACLKIEKNNLQPLAFAEEPLAVGNEVYTMGFPLAAVTSQITDKEATFMEGKVSAIKQTRQEAEFVQTNAALNLGNAGGPLLNKDGQVGGIVVYSNDKSFSGKYFKSYKTFIELFEDTPSVGIGFAAPTKYALNLLTNANIQITTGGINVTPPLPGGPAANADNVVVEPPIGSKHQPTDNSFIKWLLGGLALLILIGLIAYILGKKKPVTETASPMPAGAKNTSISFGSIKFTNGELEGKTFSLTAKGFNIGRDSDNDICLTAEIVSRKHCWIGPTGDGIVVKDIGSTNGTYINGSKIEGTKTVKPGDVISLSKSGQEAFTILE